MNHSISERLNMKSTINTIRCAIPTAVKATVVLGLAASVVFGVAGCGGVDSSNVKSILHPAQIGTWKLVSLASGVNKVTCPGTGLLGAKSNFTCSADSKMIFKSDGSFVESFITPAGSSGHWFATGTHLMMDDDQGEDNPVVYTAVLNGSNLILKTYEGGFVAEYVREGAASTLTHQDIVAANPALEFDKLMDVNLVGKWQYKSITYAGVITQCPGDTNVSGIKCGSNEVAQFTADNKFVDTVSSNSHDSGTWYTYRGRLYMDDSELADHDPIAWTYDIKNDSMTMKKWGGLFVVNATKIK